MFQAVLTVPDIDADSAIGTCASIITGDRSSCRFSDDEVSECVYALRCYEAKIEESEKAGSRWELHREDCGSWWLSG